jgi:hypothetical protein
MLRTAIHVGFALLLAVTLVWGGCISCSQYFMFAGSRDNCCHPSGHCGKVPAPARDCNIQPMAVVKAPSLAAPALSAAVLPAAIAVPASPAGAGVSGAALPPSDASPPDLCLRHSILRI